MPAALRQYLLITGNYWLFTITDGAIRMLVVLYFYQLGYSPFEIALLFLFYEFFGIVTNLVGGYLGARLGLNRTMQLGTGLQIIALLMLTVPESWLGVVYVMAAQALSGIAKDLNKMSAKAGVKIATAHAEDKLFSWVAWITGSKNALKGVGFFVGSVLLAAFGFQIAVLILAGLVSVGFLLTTALPAGYGAIKAKPKFGQIFAREPAINWLAAARLFLFAARDVWFVVALPLYLVSIGWDFQWVGAYLALWVIGYGVAQASAPRLFALHPGLAAHGPGAKTAVIGCFALLLPLMVMLGLVALEVQAGWVITLGLAVFGVIFALNSATHSYLILAFSDGDKTAMNVGFYYAANAGGRLLGTVLSGVSYQWLGISGALAMAVVFVFIAAVLTMVLERKQMALG